MSAKFPPVAPPAPKAPGTPQSGQHPPYFRPSISLGTAPLMQRQSISGRDSLSSNNLPPMSLSKDPSPLATLPSAPVTPQNAQPPPNPLSLRPPASSSGIGIISGVPEIGVLNLTILADTQDNVDDAVDKFEGYRHLFDMASQGFRIERDIFTVNITMAKVEEFLGSPEFELLLTTQVDPDAQKQARGFKMAYEKEVEHVGRYLHEQCEVIMQMIKLFISTPGEKLHGQKDALRKVVEEGHNFSRYPGSTINQDLIQQAEGILSQLELQDGLLQQIQQATTAKDMDKLDNYLARASAAGIKADHSSQMAEAHRVYAELQKQHAKKAKTMKKGEQLPPSPFYDLSSVIANSSFFVGLNSVLPIKTDYKSIPKDQMIPTEANKLPGIDLSVVGIDTMPNLDYFMDQYLLVPLILYDCLQFIRYNFGWREEGLFRLSGNNETIANALVKYDHQHMTCMNNGGYVASEQGFLRPVYTGPFTDIHPTLLVQLFTSPHDATNVMKRWLRSLEQPVIPFENYKSWADVTLIPHTVADITKVDLLEDIKTSPKLQKIHQLIHELPQDNRGILMYLSLYLYCVSLNSGVSKMTADNLAIVVAPNLLRTKEEAPSRLPSSPSSNGGPASPMSPSAMLMAMRSGGGGANDLLNQSKVVNEVIGLVFKYAPVLFAPLAK